MRLVDDTSRVGKVYTIAYVNDRGGEVIFNYTKPGSDELNYYTNISRDYNVSEEIFDDLWMNLYYLFKNLRNLFKQKNMNHGHHANLTLQETEN